MNKLKKIHWLLVEKKNLLDSNLHQRTTYLLHIYCVLSPMQCIEGRYKKMYDAVKLTVLLNAQKQPHQEGNMAK